MSEIPYNLSLFAVVLKAKDTGQKYDDLKPDFYSCKSTDALQILHWKLFFLLKAN